MAIGHNFSGLRVLYLTLAKKRFPIRSGMTRRTRSGMTRRKRSGMTTKKATGKAAFFKWYVL